MNSIFAAGASIALALLLSTQISSPAKTSALVNQKQLHRVAVQVDVNDPAAIGAGMPRQTHRLQGGPFGLDDNPEGIWTLRAGHVERPGQAPYVLCGRRGS
jgi:hypothetical protein